VRLDDFLNTVQASNVGDWTTVHSPSFLQHLEQTSSSDGSRWLEVEGHHTVFSYKEDLRISIAFGLSHRENFQEPWTKNFPDPSASSVWIDFLYNGRPVLRSLMVLVDGARCGLPLPSNKTMSVPQRQADIWRLLNALQSSYDFDQYISDAGITVTSSPWP
jgi:hypothetical protein